ncbi:MAG: hypothetical protein JO018_02490 [Candidatus Eremiobacteraeota bacterium]|nr:hypothetical protein [Candidatus Eremiobacteraeota bacterium]
MADIADPLLSYGTTTYSRIAFRRELDKIAADTEAGRSFSLRALSEHFDRGLALLADEELHPAFPNADFATVKRKLSMRCEGSKLPRLTSCKWRSQMRFIRRVTPSGVLQRRKAPDPSH